MVAPTREKVSFAGSKMPTWFRVKGLGFRVEGLGARG